MNIPARISHLVLHARVALRSQLVRGGVGSILVKAVYIPLQMCVGVIIARALGPAGLGAYATTIAIVQLISVIAQFGFPQYLLRSIPICEIADAPGKIKSLSRIALITSGVLGVATSVIAIFVMHFGFRPSAARIDALMTGMILVPILAMLSTNAGVIQGRGHGVLGQLPTQIVLPALYLTSLLAVAAFSTPLSPQGAILLYIAVAAAALAVGQIIALKVLPHGKTSPPSSADIRDWLSAAFPYLTLAGALIFQQQIDLLMLGVMTPPQEVGLYRAALQMVDGLAVPLFGLSIVIAPTLARVHAAQNWARFQRILVVSQRVGISIVFPLGAIAAIWGRPILSFIYGDPFADGGQVLAILAAGKIAYASVGLAGLALGMMGRPAVATVIIAATATLNVALNLYLIPLYGIEGAAASAVVSSLLVNIGALLWMKQTYGLNFSAFAGLRYKAA